MIKFFCDICGVQLFESNTCSSHNDLRSKDISFKESVINIRVNINSKQGGNDVCTSCVKEIINNA